jgi:transposase InsO family protein
MLSVCVVLDHASRQLLPVNITAHSTAPWTRQQCREAISAAHAYRIFIHAWDARCSKDDAQGVRPRGLHVIQTPVRTPVVQARGERVLGTMRRACLDGVMPLHARHLYGILQAWVTHDNEGRPHMSLGPGMPRPKRTLPVPRQVHRHRMPTGQRRAARPVLGGLHHDYRLEKQAA